MSTADRLFWKLWPARLAGGMLLAGCCGLASAGGAEYDAGRRESARAAIEARYREAVQACQSRFAVNACLQEAKAARQQALRPLQDQALAESLAQREQRASESRLRLQQKAQEQAHLEAQKNSAALMAPPSRSRAVEPAPAAEPASRPARPLPDVQQQRTEDEAAAAQRAREQRSRLQKAEQHRQQVLKRLQERTQHKPLAAPLPPASGASPPR